LIGAVALNKEDREGLAAAVGLGALSAGLFLGSAVLPIFGAPMSFFSAVPIAVVANKTDFKGFAVASAVGTALLLAVGAGDPAAALMFFFGVAAAGGAMGYALRKDLQPECAVGSYAILAFAAFWIGAYFIAREQGVSITSMLMGVFERSIDEASAAFLEANAKDQQLKLAVQEWSARVKSGVPGIFPGILAAFCIFSGWANSLLVRRFEMPENSWLTWKAPEQLIWLLIASGMVAAIFTEGFAATVALNVFIAVATVYFFQGLAVLQYLFEKRAFPIMVRIAAYTLLILPTHLAFVLAGVGAFDLWIDFRSRWAPEPPASGSGSFD